MNVPEWNEMRDKVTALFACIHMEDKHWQRLADVFDWNNVWPVVDKDCCLTGEVVEPTDWKYLPVWPSWDAVISREEASAAGWTVNLEDGYAIHPKEARRANLQT